MATTKFKERFDLNSGFAQGVVQRLWGRGNDVFARLRVPTGGSDEEKVTYITLRFPEGRVAGTPVTLSPGIEIKVGGFLTQTKFTETILKVLDAAGEREFLANVPVDDKEAWTRISFVRRNAMLNVLAAAWVGADLALGETGLFDEFAQSDASSGVALEGVIASTWEYTHDAGVHLFARLACYDPHTPIAEGKGDRFGRPRRRPHYVTIKMEDGKVDGFPVKLAKKMRLRVLGFLEDQGGRVNLHEQLLDTGKSEVIELMSRLPNADRLAEIVSQQSSIHIKATSLIVYSDARKGLKS